MGGSPAPVNAFAGLFANLLDGNPPRGAGQHGGNHAETEPPQPRPEESGPLSVPLATGNIPQPVALPPPDSSPRFPSPTRFAGDPEGSELETISRGQLLESGDASATANPDPMPGTTVLRASPSLPPSLEPGIRPAEPEAAGKCPDPCDSTVSPTLPLPSREESWHTAIVAGANRTFVEPGRDPRVELTQNDSAASRRGFQPETVRSAETPTIDQQAGRCSEIAFTSRLQVRPESRPPARTVPASRGQADRRPTASGGDPASESNLAADHDLTNTLPLKQRTPIHPGSGSPGILSDAPLEAPGSPRLPSPDAPVPSTPASPRQDSRPESAARLAGPAAATPTSDDETGTLAGVPVMRPVANHEGTERRRPAPDTPAANPQKPAEPERTRPEPSGVRAPRGVARTFLQPASPLAVSSAAGVNNGTPPHSVATLGVPSTGQASGQGAPKSIAAETSIPQIRDVPLSVHVARAELVANASQSSQSPASHTLVLRISDPEGATATVRVAESHGDVRVAVRTSEPGLAADLRSGLHELAGKLESAGVKADFWVPSEAATAVRATDSNSGTGQSLGEHGPGGGQRDPREDNPRQRPAPDWLEQFEAIRMQQPRQKEFSWR